MARGKDESRNPNRRPTNPNLTSDGKVDYHGQDWWNRSSNMSNMQAETRQGAQIEYNRGMALINEMLDNDGFDQWQNHLQLIGEYKDARAKNPSLTRDAWFDQRNAEDPNFETSVHQRLIHPNRTLDKGQSVRDYFNDDVIENPETWEW